MTSGEPSSSSNLKYFTNRFLKPSNKSEDSQADSSNSASSSTIEPVYNPSFISRLSSFRRNWAHTRCVANTAWCLKNDPGVRLLVEHLQELGCEVKPERHISCEPCGGVVNGGFHVYSSEIVLCENFVTRRADCCQVLAHELLHAYDVCRGETDFDRNIEQRACSEIRALNFFHCGYLSSVWEGYLSTNPLRIRNRHRDCVRDRAALLVRVGTEATAELSLQLQQQQQQQQLQEQHSSAGCAEEPAPLRELDAPQAPLSATEARRVVDSVFNQCYNDLAPFGRRLRGRGHNSIDARHALELKHLRDQLARLYSHSSSLPNDGHN